MTFTGHTPWSWSVNDATSLPFSHGAEARLTLVLEDGKDTVFVSTGSASNCCSLLASVQNVAKSAKVETDASTTSFAVVLVIDYVGS